MNIKATFPAGVDELIVHGLHQWDYGRKLEIEADDLPALVEVHFACAGMKEAVVRSCSIVNGVGTATIPDACLEQTAPITAWVYAIDGTAGATVKTILLTVTERARPAGAEEIPTEVSDKYTEAITAMNTQIEALRAGNVTVNRALQANNATTAESATTATKAHKVIDCDFEEVEMEFSLSSEVGGNSSALLVVDPEQNVIGYDAAENISVGHAAKANKLAPSWQDPFDGGVRLTLNSSAFSADYLEAGKTYLFKLGIAAFDGEHTFVLTVSPEASTSTSSTSLFRTLNTSPAAMDGMLSLQYSGGALTIFALSFSGETSGFTIETAVTLQYVQID